MEIGRNLSILLVDDHSLILQGIRRIIEQLEGISRVDTAASGAEAGRLIAAGPYDIYLLDIELPDCSGFDLIGQIREKDEDARIIVNTMHEKSWMISRLVKLEVNAIILKSSDAQVVAEAIRSVVNNKSYCCPRFEHVRRKLRYGIGAELHEDDVPTKRELEVLKAIAEGNNTPRIAEIMNVSENTVETYRKRLFLKFNAKNAVDLIVKAVAKGWVKIE